MIYPILIPDGGSTLSLIFRKSWFITARFHSIHLRAYFPQVNVTIALIVFYWQLSVLGQATDLLNDELVILWRIMSFIEFYTE